MHQVVYIIVGNKEIYFNQLSISLSSLLNHNPNIKVKILTDKTTSNIIKHDWKNLIADKSEIIEIEIPDFYNTFLTQSRFIKTNLRKFLKGDFLFIDTDTIVCKNIEEIFNCEYEIGMVSDYHVRYLKDHNELKELELNFKKVKWKNYDIQFPYYNSGIIWSKDNVESYNFFSKWSELYKQLLEKYNFNLDQLSLNIINNKLRIIKSLPDIYNCQIDGNGLRFFYEAKIVHYFNATGNNDKPFLIQNQETQEILKNEIIKDYNFFKSFIIFNYFDYKVKIIGNKEISFFETPTYQILNSKLKTYANILNFLSKIFLEVDLFKRKIIFNLKRIFK